jgi:N-methylhydantoinase A/oxoprolinase/acetone carboxylase beta subunit
MRLDSFNAAATELLSGMARDIRAWVEPAAAGEPVVERRVAFMRYVGQGHEIAVELPVRDLLATDTAALRARYEADYEKMFRRSIPAAALEIMALSVNVSTVSQLLEQIADVDQYPLSMVGESIRIFDGRPGQADRRVALPSRQAVGRRPPVRAGDHRRRGDVNLRHREFRRLDRWSGFHRDGTQGNNSVNKPGLTLSDKQVMWSY